MVIPLPDTVENKWTVMVKFPDTFITNVTMACSMGSPCNTYRTYKLRLVLFKQIQQRIVLFGFYIPWITESRRKQKNTLWN